MSAEDPGRPLESLCRCHYGGALGLAWPLNHSNFPLGRSVGGMQAGGGPCSVAAMRGPFDDTSLILPVGSRMSPVFLLSSKVALSVWKRRFPVAGQAIFGPVHPQSHTCNERVMSSQGSWIERNHERARAQQKYSGRAERENHRVVEQAHLERMQ